MVLSYQEIQALIGRCFDDIYTHDPNLPIDFLATVDREGVLRHARFDTYRGDMGEVMLFFTIGTTFYTLTYKVGIAADHIEPLVRVARGIGDTRTRLYPKEVCA
jgi:hypothetical protein